LSCQYDDPSQVDLRSGGWLVVADVIPDELSTREVIRDPYPAYRRLRERSPFNYEDLPAGTVPGIEAPLGSWALLKFSDVYSALRDHETFSSVRPLVGTAFPPLVMVFDDPPWQDRLFDLTSRMVVLGVQLLTSGEQTPLRYSVRYRATVMPPAFLATTSLPCSSSVAAAIPAVVLRPKLVITLPPEPNVGSSCPLLVNRARAKTDGPGRKDRDIWLSRLPDHNYVVV
jgi:hypothetical protein